MGRRALLIAGCLAFGASACGAGAPVSVGPAPSTAESTPETTATSAEEAELDAKGLLAQVRPSVGLITTPISQGSGVLIEGGYIVTNAHVVQGAYKVQVQLPAARRGASRSIVGPRPRVIGAQVVAIDELSLIHI